MSDMRKLINLMENIQAVPAIGQLDEKSTSEKQARFMAAAAHDPKFAKNAGIEQGVAKEFNQADTGTELLSKAAKNKEESCSMEEAHVDTCRQTNRSPARDACAMEEDLNNGYDDVTVLDGQDFFPNGADGPVVTKVGPSGAKQGDNPEQKKMQVAETHKELVYAYRKYLKESAPSVDSKKKLKESQQVVSNVEVQDYHGDFEADSDSIGYDGAVSFSATVLGRNGQPVNIGYDLDITASAEVGWESDESPTGWNYSTDNPTYTSYEYATAGAAQFSNIQFTENQPIIVDDNEMSLHDAQQHIDPAVLKQLLQPELFTQWFNSMFDKKAEDMEPPEADFDEPDRYDYDDRDY